MKKIFWIFAICLSAFNFTFAQDDNQAYNNSDDVYYNGDDNANTVDPRTTYDDSYQSFYDELSPYGHWVNYSNYGYVWVPTQVSADFSPYLSSGHWAYTDYGWTWVSDYSWGWAPFHYGRWFHDNAYGWMWRPGSEWAPAWVTWGSYSGYYCWAPIAPFCSVSVSYRPQSFCWNFVPCANIYQVNLGGYCRNNDVYIHNNINIISTHITIINEHGSYNHANYFAGPKVQEVERVSGHSVAHMNIASASRPSATHLNGTQISMYRPEIKSHANQTAVPNQHRENLAPERRNNVANQNMQRSNFQTPAQHNPVQQNANREVQNQRMPVTNQRPYNQPQTMSRPAQQQPSVNQNAARNNMQMPVQRNNSQNQAAQQRMQQQSQPARQNMNAPAQRTFAQNQQVQRPTQQYSQQRQAPARQNYQAPAQHNFSQPVQRSASTNFASAQRSTPTQSHASSIQSARSSSPVRSRGR